MEFSSEYVNVAETRKSQVPNLVNIRVSEVTESFSSIVVDDANIKQCCTCGAVLTKKSPIRASKTLAWDCEFCNNTIEIDNAHSSYTIPDDDVDILLTSPLQTSKQSDHTEESYFIFCIDTSNSMGKTLKVKTKLLLEHLRIPN